MIEDAYFINSTKLIHSSSLLCFHHGNQQISKIQENDLEAYDGYYVTIYKYGEKNNRTQGADGHFTDRC